MDDRTREGHERLAVGQAAGNTGRKPYRRPVLTEYGPVAKLTQGTLTTASDGPSGTMKKPCL